jgi:hypothetical protein
LLVVAVYAGAVLLGVHLLLGRQWSGSTGFVAGALLLGAVSWFSVAVVFRADPIRVDAMSTPHTLADSDGGIRWKPEYYETHIDFYNDTDDDYSDLDIQVGSDRGIADLSQATKHDGIEFPPEVLAVGA